jgi:magnesium transporter
VSLFCGEGYVLSFHDQYDESSYEFLHTRWKKNSNHIRHNDRNYLLYVLLDLIIDSGYPVLEWFGEQLDSIEESLIDRIAKIVYRIFKISHNW